MKAIIQHTYGSPDTLELADVPRPTVGDDEVLVRVRAASVHADVWHVIRGFPLVLRVMGSGVRRPKTKIPGTDLAGTVEAVGRDVTRFEGGDAVFGESLRGHQWANGGAFAEYAAVPESGLQLKPDRITFEEAAAIPTSGLIALQGVHYQGQVEPGESVLVNGAGGGVGTFAVQLARAYEATVTAVDHMDKLRMLRNIGADHVIDYTTTDFTTGTDRYDLIVDIPGNYSFSKCKRVLTPQGVYVLIGHDQYNPNRHRLIGTLRTFLQLIAMSPFVSGLPDAKFVSPDKQDSLRVLTEFIEDGKLTPVVDRTFSLKDVPAAIQYLETGEVQGKIVITV